METTTTLRFKNIDEAGVAGLVPSLEEALVSEIRQSAPFIVSAYFVQSQGLSIQIGLRFTSIDPANVEDVTQLIVQNTLASVNSGLDESTQGKRTSTLLVGV